MPNQVTDILLARCQKIIEVVQAFAEGRDIESSPKVYTGEFQWSLCPVPGWDFANFDYRVKPKPRPFTLEELYKHIGFEIETHVAGDGHRCGGQLLGRITGITHNAEHDCLAATLVVITKPVRCTPGDVERYNQFGVTVGALAEFWKFSKSGKPCGVEEETSSTKDGTPVLKAP